MKLFQQNEILEAYAHAAQGGQALHLCDGAFARYAKGGRSPARPFRGVRIFAHLIDGDIERLKTTARSSSTVPNARSAGLSQPEPSQLPGTRRNDKGRAASELYRIPIFPPGPNQLDQWRRVLEVAPALEPAVRGMVDGMADRVDRLRLCGNGVVPLAAAVAFRVLCHNAGIELGEP